MNQKIAAITSLIAVAVVGGVTFNVRAPVDDITAANYADAGITGPNRVATCAVRVSTVCQSRFNVRQYETIRFPVYVSAIVNSERNMFLPPKIGKNCVRVMDWDECVLDPLATFPAVAAKWDDNVPMTLARTFSKWRIPNCRLPDGGWDDQMGEDGGAVPDCKLDGTRWAGCNILPRNRLVGTQCLDAPSGVLTNNERIEDSL